MHWSAVLLNLHSLGFKRAETEPGQGGAHVLHDKRDKDAADRFPQVSAQLDMHDTAFLEAKKNTHWVAISAQKLTSLNVVKN